MRTIGTFLMAASLPFFLDTAFEMYLLTLIHGQQMLFFSLAHIAPVFLIVVWLSGAAFAGLGVFALGVVVLNLVGALDAGKSYSKLMLVILLVQVVHTALLITYDGWAPAFG